VTVLRSGSATDVGRVRQINQDLPLEAPNLFAVADGMGGHVGGEVAARVAIDALLSSFTREPTTNGLLAAFSEANRSVWQESQDQSDLHGMGTTLTAVALVGGADGRDMIALANVGDSRAYVFSEGRITQVTADHSLAEERMRHGEMTEEEAAVHPQRHILTRALGVSPDVEADMWELQLRAGDRIVLCSDGLSNEVGPEVLSEILSSEADPGAASRRMVEAANAHGGADNITVVVVDVLVGEEGGGSASVVKPLGERAGPPLIVTPMVAEAAADAADHAAEGTPEPVAEAPADAAPGAPTTGEVPATASAEPITQAVPVTSAAGSSQSDALAPGAQLGFGGDSTRLGSGEDGPKSGEHFLGNTQGALIARSTVEAAPLPQPAPAPPNESRRARRRRLGIPRRITVRVLLFVLLLAGIVVAAFFAIRWYAYDNWYPAVQGNNIAVMQGRSGGVLWFKPKVVDETVVVDKTKVTTSKVLPDALAHIKAGVEEPSLQAARRYVANSYAAYRFQQSSKTQPGGNGSTGPGPSGGGSTTTTTVPGQPVAPDTTPTTFQVTP
jgi:serine/threonine protein phosphatase PrpC